MSEVVAWDEFVGAHAALSREEFLARVREPALLLRRADVEDATDPFETGRFDLAALRRRAGEGTLGLAFVRKGTRNPFGLMVTIGRAANNDVVVPDGGVSKFHAYIQAAGETYRLSDARSRNGTAIDGTPVPPGFPATLRSGARVLLGDSVVLVFLAPADLYERVALTRAERLRAVSHGSRSF